MKDKMVPLCPRQVNLWVRKGGHVRKLHRTKALLLSKGSPPKQAKEQKCYAGPCWEY